MASCHLHLTSHFHSIQSSPLSSCLKSSKWNSESYCRTGERVVFPVWSLLVCKHIALKIGPAIAMTMSVEVTELKSEMLMVKSHYMFTLCPCFDSGQRTWLHGPPISSLAFLSVVAV